MIDKISISNNRLQVIKCLEEFLVDIGFIVYKNIIAGRPNFELNHLRTNLIKTPKKNTQRYKTFCRCRKLTNDIINVLENSTNIEFLTINSTGIILESVGRQRLLKFPVSNLAWLVKGNRDYIDIALEKFAMNFL